MSLRSDLERLKAVLRPDLERRARALHAELEALFPRAMWLATAPDPGPAEAAERDAAMARVDALMDELMDLAARLHPDELAALRAQPDDDAAASLEATAAELAPAWGVPVAAALDRLAAHVARLEGAPR